ncbi:MAG: hypothetical protein KatS3mg002_0347 [Candidatus Woesearchaeota archaeon]|nr:MAG: hypothetical protein KatS3mg002_0347 [Candidatus Woesearchaeota archaeon]
MSCVVAVKDERNRRIYIGADSAVSTDTEISFFKNKIYQLSNDCIVGITGNIKIANAISRFNNKNKIGKTFEETLDKIYELFNEMSIIGVNTQNQTPFFEGNLAIIFKGKLYEVSCDFGYMERDSYLAVGSGASYAYGSLFATKKSKNPRQRVFTALEASAYFSPYVRAPFSIIEIDY